MTTTENNGSVDRTLTSPDVIVLATDLTDTDYLVPHVVAQAKSSGARVSIVHAIFRKKQPFADASGASRLPQSKHHREKSRALRRVAKQLEAEGIRCEISLREGLPGPVIAREVIRTGAMRLVLGTHGRGKLGQLVLGSVANEILGAVDVPIFAVGPKCQGSHTIPRRIVHPVSFMGKYVDTVCLAIGMAQRYGAELTLLHVLDKNLNDEVNPERTLAWAKNSLATLLPPTGEDMPPARTLVRVGDTVTEILAAAEDLHSDWIVLGVNAEFSGNNTAYKICSAAPCPVLALWHNPYREACRHIEELPNAEQKGVPIAVG